MGALRIGRGPAPTDDWGRELAFTRRGGDALRPPALVLDNETILARIEDLRTAIRTLENQVGEGTGAGGGPLLGGPAWTRRLSLAVADHWEISLLELTGRSRKTIVSRPRFVLCWLLRKAGDFSFARIAVLVGYDSHTTVNHAVRRVDEWRAADEVLRHDSDQLLAIARRLRAERPAPLAGPAAPSAEGAA